MFECSDLNAPQKAKSFKKPSVKEVQPKQVRVSNFQASQKSRKWDNQTEELSDLFTLPGKNFYYLQEIIRLKSVSNYWKHPSNHL